MSSSSGTDDNPNQTQVTQEISHIDKEMVGLDIGKSSHNKQRKRRSDVWKKFKKYKDKDGNDKAKCSLCEKLFDGSSKKGTTHLRNHFRSCQNKKNGGAASGSGDKPARNSVTDQQLNHLDINQFNSCQNKSNECGASCSGDKPAGNSVTDQQLNHLDRVKMLLKDGHWFYPKQIGDNDVIIHVYNEEREKKSKKSKSSRNKQKKLRSDVWKMFEECKDENGKDLAKCSLCEKLFDGSSKKGTTHLRNHFRSCQNKRNGGGASGSRDKPAGNSVTDQQLNHLDINQFNNCQNKRNEGGASGSGDKPAGNSVTDQQLNHLDINQFNSCQNKRKEGGASGSGDKPAGNSVTDQQLNHLDRVKMLIKQGNWDSANQVGDADLINVYNEEKEKLRIYLKKLHCRFSLMIRYTEDVFFVDEEAVLDMPGLLAKMAEGMLLPPPQCGLEGDDVANDDDLSLWSYPR